jgi:hypothetical protein
MFYQKHCPHSKGIKVGQTKNVLPNIITEVQSAFVPGRLIMDDILIEYECMHTIIRRKDLKNLFFALKIDMMKTYDRVEWNYLEGVPQKMGFEQTWVKSVMRCVTSVRYSIKINGGRV